MGHFLEHLFDRVLIFKINYADFGFRRPTRRLTLLSRRQSQLDFGVFRKVGRDSPAQCSEPAS